MPEADRDGKWSYLKSYYDDYEYPVAMPIVRIDAYVTNKVVAPSDSVNVTAFLDEAQASYGEEAIDGF